mgnify:CR=1 FL=1
MRIFVCGGVDADMDKKYKEGIKELIKITVEKSKDECGQKDCNLVTVGHKTVDKELSENQLFKNGADYSNDKETDEDIGIIKHRIYRIFGYSAKE